MAVANEEKNQPGRDHPRGPDRRAACKLSLEPGRQPLVVRRPGQTADYRFSARRGNWTGREQEKATVWAKVHTGFARSSGSVPEATPDAQDTAGHDGFKSMAAGLAIGTDYRFENGLIGISAATFSTQIEQLDDRAGELATQKHQVGTLYGRLNGRNEFVSLSYSVGTGSTSGERKTAIARTADYRAPFDSTQIAVKAGYRFDISDGKSAVTPFVRATRSEYRQSQYQETGAGDLSLNVHDYDVARSSYEVGADASFKGRFFGKRALAAFSVATGKERALDDLTITANYTGMTHTMHPGNTTFTTPAERWAERFVKLGTFVQIEPTDGLLARVGADFQARKGRQNLAGNVDLIWYFD